MSGDPMDEVRAAYLARDLSLAHEGAALEALDHAHHHAGAIQDDDLRNLALAVHLSLSAIVRASFR